MEKQCFSTVFYMIRNEPFLPHTIIYPIIYQAQIGVKKLKISIYSRKSIEKLLEKDFPEVDDLAEFIFNAKKEGKDIICQCEYGESRSSGCAAAIHEYFYKDGIKIFADYRYYPNQMVYHKVYDALEKYGVEKNVIRESGE